MCIFEFPYREEPQGSQGAEGTERSQRGEIHGIRCQERHLSEPASENDDKIKCVPRVPHE